MSAQLQLEQSPASLAEAKARIIKSQASKVLRNAMLTQIEKLSYFEWEDFLKKHGM